MQRADVCRFCTAARDYGLHYGLHYQEQTHQDEHTAATVGHSFCWFWPMTACSADLVGVLAVRRTFVLSSMGIVMIFGCDGSSASLWNDATYGCASASSADILLAGLNCVKAPQAPSPMASPQMQHEPRHQ